jgi:hypothetical protein
MVGIPWRIRVLPLEEEHHPFSAFVRNNFAPHIINHKIKLFLALFKPTNKANTITRLLVQVFSTLIFYGTH